MSPAEPVRTDAPGALRQPASTHGPQEPVRWGDLVKQSQPDLRLVERPARRRKTRPRHRLVPGVIALASAVSLGLVALHVLIAENQFTLDNLQQEASAQQQDYEHLRLDIAQLESPARVVSVAEDQLGMQQPASVTYLPAVPSGAGTGRSSASSGVDGQGVLSSGGGTAAGTAGAGGEGTVRAPQGDANWPSIKPYLSGSP